MYPNNGFNITTDVFSVINRVDPRHVIRQNNKKTSAVRKNAQVRGSRMFP